MSDLDDMLDYIALHLDTNRETEAVSAWVSVMDDAIDDRNEEAFHQLVRLIHAWPLSTQSQAHVSLSRAEWYARNEIVSLAVDAYQRALALFQAVGDREHQAISAAGLALFCQKLGHYETALIHYHLAAKLYRQLKDHESLGQMLSNLGSLADERRQWTEAVHYYRRAVRELKQVQATLQLASVYNNLGVAYEMLLNWKRAEFWYDHCVDCLDSLGETYSAAGWRVLNNLGSLYAKVEKRELARRCYEAALMIADKLANDLLLAQAWNNLGTLSQEWGETEQAADQFRQALHFQSQSGERMGQATLLNNLAAVLFDLKQYSQAEVCYRESLALSREARDRTGEARTLNNLGTLLEGQGDLVSAIGFYQEAVDQFSQLGDQRRTIVTMTNLASALWKSGREIEGRQVFLRAWPLASQKTYEVELAKLYLLRGDHVGRQAVNHSMVIGWYRRAQLASQASMIQNEVKRRLDWFNAHRREELNG